MKKIILHIGRHKTGTTAIQRFLCTNRQWLNTRGFYYPEYGIRGFGHHDIGALVTRRQVAESDLAVGDIVHELRQEIDKEISAIDSTIVFSSEAFQNCDPQVVKKLFAGFDMKIVVYLREQVRYLLSAYVQKVQATQYTGSLEDFFEDNSHTTYKEFLQQWESAFTNKIKVKNYDKEELLRGNVVVDFCSNFLDLDPESVEERCDPSDANPSLTRDLVDFKRRLNKSQQLSNESARMVFTGLAKLAVKDQSGAITISKSLRDRVCQRYQTSNEYVAKKYFDRDQLFRPFRMQLPVAVDENLEQRLAGIRKRLVELRPELDEHLVKADQLVLDD